MANNQTMMVTLRFNSDTTQAKKDIQSLIQEIGNLSTQNWKNQLTGNFSKEIREASTEVQKFSVILRDAVNVNTGKLDLSKLNASLKASNTNLKQVATSFSKLGEKGVESFSNIVSQINAAEIPLKKTNAIVDKLWLSLKNTVNWQISSSAVHALVGGFESAFRYAEDLNESLNNIRIVSGYSADKMADFAKEANKAAKALSTTTVDYTDAALIYYQQGLTDEEVKTRTDVTIKMANAAQESATIVSDQLTAIWNNFYDGSQSLEYYADVLTKLGAATASSTDEISQGLEKFAAVADTIGLSYEYATAALTTITSNTRQSADVVGTALKTIFARMQDLEQGSTLDDGTTLGTYSQALAKVGIQVLDTKGNLVDMDDILDQMGEKWETLSKAQQVALAQQVAGKLMLA